jgi:hypothetical protein
MNPVLSPRSKIETCRGSDKSSFIRVASKEGEEENPIPVAEGFWATNHHVARLVRHSA